MATVVWVCVSVRTTLCALTLMATVRVLQASWGSTASTGVSTVVVQYVYAELSLTTCQLNCTLMNKSYQVMQCFFTACALDKYGPDCELDCPCHQDNMIRLV